MILFSIDSQKDDAKINITFSGLKDMLESKPIIGIHEIGKQTKGIKWDYYKYPFSQRK